MVLKHNNRLVYFPISFQYHAKLNGSQTSSMVFNRSTKFQYHASLNGSQTGLSRHETTAWFQYHASLNGSQTSLDLTFCLLLFQYHASLNGSQTSLADTIRAWSSTLAVFPQILAEPLDVLAKRWSLN